MVYVYVTDISNLPDPLVWPEMIRDLPACRKEKILSFRQSRDRRQCMGAGLLLNQVLNLYGKSSGNIYYGANGKPQMDGFFFNLAHAHNMVVCAVSSMEIGCDIERIASGREHIARNFFTVNEQKYLQAFKGEQRLSEFFRIWTMKESYLKMTGEGLSAGLDSFEIVFRDIPEIIRFGERCSCFLQEYNIPGYKMTACAQEQEFADFVTVEI